VSEKEKDKDSKRESEGGGERERETDRERKKKKKHFKNGANEKHIDRLTVGHARHLVALPAALCFLHRSQQQILQVC